MSQGLLNFVVVGAKNSGKTVFLSTLFGVEPSLATANKETTEYLKANWDELKTGILPSATSSRVITLEFEYKTDIYSVGFHIDDYDGYFVETLGVDEAQTQEDRDKLRKNIKEAEGLLFFFPFEKTFDEESLERFRYEINTFIQLIKDVYPDQKDLPIPVVIAISKWDRSSYFGARDQNQKAIEYIDSVEAYKAAMAMIQSFFANVKIEPVSSFGNTDDGIHPVKGKIEPFNLKGPFDYFLDVTFHKFEKKAEELRATNDLPKLYEFLTAIYNDVRFYKEGMLIKLHADVETEYTSDIIEKLRRAASPGEQNDILNEHSFLYENIRNKEFAAEIESVVSTKKTKRNKRAAVIVSSIVFAIIILVYGLLAYKAYEKEHTAYVTIQKVNLQNMPKEFAKRCLKYLEKYHGKSFLLPFTDIAAHRQYVEGALSSAKSAFVEKLTQVYDRIRGEEPNEQNLVEIRELLANADLFPNLEISQRIREFSDQFSTRLERKQEITSILNEAKSLLASDPDLSEVDNMLAQLHDLPDNGEISEIKTKLSQRLRTLQLQSEFNRLYNEIKEARTFLEIPKIIGKKWRADFPENFAQTLKGLVQDKIAAMDSAAINDLKDRFESVMAIDEQKKIIEEIDTYSIEIPQLQFHYERNQYLKDKFENAKNSTDEYKRVLDHGVPISSIRFGATSKKNEPLGFACGAFKGNEIFLTFENVSGSVTFTHEGKRDCNANEDGSQVMWWDAQGSINAGTHHIQVTEKDLFDSESIDTTISISKTNLLQIYNYGEMKFAFPYNSTYFVVFAK